MEAKEVEEAKEAGAKEAKAGGVTDLAPPSPVAAASAALGAMELRDDGALAEEGEIGLSSNPDARERALGFRINAMNMRDATNGALKWDSGLWSTEMWERELEARIPADILACPAVSREINFTSALSMEKFRLEQRIFFQGVCMEEWFFDFGFVIPGSTNTWQNTIEAAGGDQMLPAPMLSGNVTIETTFYDGETYLAKCLVRVFYVEEGAANRK